MIYKGTYLNYTVCGKGKQYVLFLHGWGGSTQSFLCLQNFLQSNYTCINLDFPPFGKSGKLICDWTVQTYAHMVLKLLRKLNIKNINIVCHSFGCRVALYIASLTNIVNKLVIISGAGIKPKLTLKKRVKIFKYKFAKLCVKLKLCPKSTLNKYGSRDYRVLDDTMKQTFKNIVNFDQTSMLKYIKCATLILWGSSDAQTPLYMAKTLNKHINDSALIVYPGDHFMYLNNLDKINIVLNKFFN